EVVRLSSRRSRSTEITPKSYVVAGFWRHLPQHEGRHSFSDGGLGYSVRPLCGRKKTSKLQGLLKTGHWSLANFQAVFGNLTGEVARPTLWRGRPRPRRPVENRPKTNQ